MRDCGPGDPDAATRPPVVRLSSRTSRRGTTTHAPAEGWCRLLRAGLLGGSSLLLASAAHVLGGGHLPDLAVLLLLLLAAAAVAAAVTSAHCRLALLLAVLTVEQLSLHAVFTAGATTVKTTHATPGGHGPMPGHAAPEVVGDQLEPVLMVVAHLLATLVTAWLLARGEALLWHVADRVVDAAAAAGLTAWPPAPARARFPAVVVVVGGAIPGGAASPRGPQPSGAARS